ncbi:hypothetical protein LAZ67_3003627 [Cordylochernes scorpioides]|uniref:C2H2-type domain-containing protein n=1 Tax=Cordylochernes scorpioides TaxID=51811 RepID=A0ABY6KDB3_9ARAC|nr:hypothetical protein LAZ67_3003627 [Cordylochernes scorpioides]
MICGDFEFSETIKPQHKQLENETSNTNILNYQLDCEDKSIFRHHVKSEISEKDYKYEHCMFEVASEPQIENTPSYMDKNIQKCEQPLYGNKNEEHKLFKQKYVVVHNKEWFYKCHSCDYKSKNKTHFVRHLMMHTGEKPFKCEYCDYKTREITTLNIHSQTHTGERPYKCKYCNYRTGRKYDFNKHLLSHKGEMPFKCNYCNFKTGRNYDFNRHLLTHKGENLTHFKKDISISEKPHDESQKSDDDQSLYEKYMFIHNDTWFYKCNSCDYKSKYKCRFVRHLVIHTCEKRFKCKYCDYKTKDISTLNQHCRIHMGCTSVVMKSNREFENRAAIIVALRAGRSPKEIVDFLKLPKTTIYRVKKQFDEADSSKEGIATRKKHSRRSDRVRGEEFVKNVKKIDGNPGKSMRP